MKKYIRTIETLSTPSGVKQRHYIYKVDETDKTISFDRPGITTIYSKNEKSLTEFVKSCVKSADTIEELCDAFVMFCPNAPRRKIRVYEIIRSISLYSKRDKRWGGNMVDKVYGAIWTDKGLIYVAKLNEEGELELL